MTTIASSPSSLSWHRSLPTPGGSPLAAIACGNHANSCMPVCNSPRRPSAERKADGSRLTHPPPHLCLFAHRPAASPVPSPSPRSTELSSVSSPFDALPKMMATPNATSTSASAQYSQLPRSVSGSKREAEPVSMTTNGEPASKRPYYGKCQYKTGKCFNERTLKRNGDAHSLCEEHRIKQNLIQRRSDRKYQTVHAIRRRERSQRRAVLKKQVSMAVAQQLFYEHQQQKTLGIPLPQHHPLHLLTASNGGSTPTPGASGIVGLAPPIQVPQSSSAFMLEGQNGIGSPLVLSFQPQSVRTDATAGTHTKMGAVAVQPGNGIKDELTPTGIDDFMPDSFLNIPMPAGSHSMPALRDDEIEETGSMGDHFGYMPIVSCSGDKETWSDDDIEFLQTILLA
ncbi:unnamed protein product [Phytophthora lilii]|uniref:Unnamed protein product n=1 Tax=Phytophthora lilii TaxID=2077276 RepID=A0A9W6WP07_9STRA|nr:unnamed protein product [Phytophthora lilii]